MKKIFFVFFVAVFFSILSAPQALAEAPIQLALVNPVQIVNEYEDIKGVRFNLLYGVNQDVSGIDLGLINNVQGEQKGIQLGMYNSTFETSGLQLGLINRTDWLDGIQIGLINIHEEGERSFFPIINFSF